MHFALYLIFEAVKTYFQIFSPFQKLSARAFDGLNNLRRLNLEQNRLARLERGIFTGVPAILRLNLNSNLLQTITYNNFLPLMDNLVNSTVELLLKGKIILLFQV